MINISDKQEEMLAFIESFVTQNGYPPTREEIRTNLNISTKSLVNYHLEALENADFLRRIPNTPRGIQLIRENGIRIDQTVRNSTYQLKLRELEYNDGDILELTYGAVTNGNNLFALKVEGDIIQDETVGQGDILILQNQKQAQDGDLVVVRNLKDGALRLRRYYCENGRVRLESLKAGDEPLLLNAGAVEIQGKVVAIIRQLENEEV
jgi:repressor LexA